MLELKNPSTALRAMPRHFFPCCRPIPAPGWGGGVFSKPGVKTPAGGSAVPPALAPTLRQAVVSFRLPSSVFRLLTSQPPYFLTSQLPNLPTSLPPHLPTSFSLLTFPTCPPPFPGVSGGRTPVFLTSWHPCFPPSGFYPIPRFPNSPTLRF